MFTPGSLKRSISLLALLAISPVGPSQAQTYGAGISNSQWYLSESVFGCTLSHEVPGYGKAVFQHRAGEALKFYLETDTPRMKPGKGVLTVEAPSWRPGVAPQPLGAVYVVEGRRSLTLEPEKTMVMVQGLLSGMAPTVTRQAWYGNEPVRVSLSNINFAPRFSDYRGCVAGLLPANYDQVKRSRIPFATDSAQLSAGDERQLDNIVAYVMADATVERILIDGHTDRVGSRIHNRTLSEERANVVAEYLKAQGVPEDLIIVRAHGERFPASTSLADNRRTTVRLERKGERSSLQQATGYNPVGKNG